MVRNKISEIETMILNSTSILQFDLVQGLHSPMQIPDIVIDMSRLHPGMSKNPHHNPTPDLALHTLVVIQVCFQGIYMLLSVDKSGYKRILALQDTQRRGEARRIN